LPTLKTPDDDNKQANLKQTPITIMVI